MLARASGNGRSLGLQKHETPAPIVIGAGVSVTAIDGGNSPPPSG
jgi:hypothetical protein